MTLCAMQGGAGCCRTKPSILAGKVQGDTTSLSMGLCSQTQMWDMNPGFSPPGKDLLVRCLCSIHTVYIGLGAGDKAITSLGALTYEPVIIFLVSHFLSHFSIEINLGFFSARCLSFNHFLLLPQ